MRREQKEWILSSKNSTAITKIFIFISNLQDLSQKLPFSSILIKFQTTQLFSCLPINSDWAENILTPW